MRLLVTGARGFIGAALVREAHACGHDVVAVDCTADGRALPPGVRSVVGDINAPAPWGDAMQGVDVVVHAAALHHVDRVMAAPIKSIEVNLRGTRLMLELAADSGVQRFVFLSSAKTYGEPLAFPSAEQDLPNPVEPYGLAKAVAERYCDYFDEQTPMRCVSIRPFSVYGPDQARNSGYIGQLIESYLTGAPAVLSGRPGFLRDFVHIDDVVHVCMAAATADHPYRVVNAGSGHATQLAALVDKFAALSGKNMEVRYKRPRPGTIERMLAGVERAGQLVGGGPATSLDEGLRSTLLWFKNADAA